MLQLDELDLALLRLLQEEPRAGSREFARILGVARGTVQARIARLEGTGVISSYAAHVAPQALGYRVEAFVHLQLAQGRLDDIGDRLAEVPEVLELHSTTGEADMLCRVAARDNIHLQSVVQQILAIPGVVRTETEISLRSWIPYRVLPLLRSRGAGQAGSGLVR